MPLDENARYVLFVNRGVLRVRQERFEDAIADLKAAIELKPKAYQAYVNLAQAYRRLDKLDLALEQLNRAVRARAGLAHLYRLRARLHLERNEPALALADFDQAIERENDEQPVPGRRPRRTRPAVACAAGSTPRRWRRSTRRWRCRRTIRWRSACGRRPCSGWAASRKSSTAFDRYLETGKPLESVYRGRGLARAELGQYPGAIEDFTKALELHPTSAVQAYRGWTHLVVDAPKLALRDFELAIELDPKNGDAYNGRGFVRASLGRHREAIAGRRGGTPPRAAVAAIALQRRADLRPVPRPLPAARTGVDPAGFELASRRRAPGLLVHAYSNGCGPGRAAPPSVVRQTGRRAVPREVIHACSTASCGLARSTASSVPRRHVPRRHIWLPDGDWLEHRTLLAASPLALAVPLHFGAFNDAEVSHFLSIPDEVDLYSVTLQSGETLDASIDAQQAGSALTSLLRVFDANGTPLALDNQQGGDPQLSFQAATAGTYYIGVSSAPNNNYNPTVADSGIPGGTTGLYTLDVRLTTRRRCMPDLTGSSFRTGVDMAAAGDTVPVSFTVQNRGGADPGNFQVQVLLADSNLFDSSSQVLATFTRSELVADATGRDFSSPAGFSVTVPAG